MSHDPLGLKTGIFPFENLEIISKLIREDDPVPQMKPKAIKKTSNQVIPQHVIELQKRIVFGSTLVMYEEELLEVPEHIEAKIC